MVTVESVTSGKIDNPQRKPSRRFPIVHIHKGIVYEAYRVTPNNRNALRDRVLPFECEFGYPNSFLIHEKVVHYTPDGGEVVFAKTQGRLPKDVGVVTQEIRRVSIEGQPVRVLSVGIRVVLPGYQRHGIGTHLAEDGIIRHKPDALTGQTRVWRIFNMYQETGLINSISPIDGPITSGMQDVLRGVLDRSVVLETDLRTGLCLGIYPPGESKRFIPPSNNQKGLANYNRMKEIGADPTQGDGIRYYAVVDQEAVLRRIVNRDQEQERVSGDEVGRLKRYLSSITAKLPFGR